MSKQIIAISGYWLPTKDPYAGYKCVLGEEWNGFEDSFDLSIFYYFKDIEDLEHFTRTEKDGRKDTEFVITKIECYDNAAERITWEHLRKFGIVPKTRQPEPEPASSGAGCQAYYDSKKSGDCTGD